MQQSHKKTHTKSRLSQPRVFKVPEGDREVYIKESQTSKRHHSLLYRLLQPAKLRRSDPQVTLCLSVFIQSLSLTFLTHSMFCSAAHCPWGTSLSKLPNPATTSAVELVLSGSIFTPKLQWNWMPSHSFCHTSTTETFSFLVCFLSTKPSSHSELCCSPYTENNLTTIIFCQFTALQTKEARENVSPKTCPLQLIINTQRCCFCFLFSSLLRLL